MSPPHAVAPPAPSVQACPLRRCPSAVSPDPRHDKNGTTPVWLLLRVDASRCLRNMAVCPETWQTRRRPQGGTGTDVETESTGEKKTLGCQGLPRCTHGDQSSAARVHIQGERVAGMTRRSCRGTRQRSHGTICCKWKCSAHRWTLPLSLLTLGLLALPRATQQVDYYPTQIAVISAPFLSTGAVIV